MSEENHKIIIIIIIIFIIVINKWPEVKLELEKLCNTLYKLGK